MNASVKLVSLLATAVLWGTSCHPEPVMAAAPTLKPGRNLTGFDDWVTAVSFHPTRPQVAAGSYDVLRLYDVEEGRQIAENVKIPGQVTALAWSPDGSRLAVGAYQRILLLNSETLKADRELSGHRGQVTSIVWTSDGETMISGSDDETIRLWSAKTFSEPRVLRSEHGPVQDLAIHNKHNLLAVAMGDPERVTQAGVVQVFALPDATVQQMFEVHDRAATAVAFEPESGRLISGGIDEKIYIHDLETGMTQSFFGGHSRPVNCLVLVSSTIVASGSGGRAVGKNEVLLWNTADGEEFSKAAVHSGPVQDIAWNPKLNLLATAGQDQRVVLWEVSGLPEATQQDQSGKPDAPAPGPDSDSN